mmetsp:Transcript_36660/g.80049  ORF Transcript_36660/g.80049 Transcript_36660/m.80049 type:complete len:105 (+) Transcript_36660:74-388(+)
MGSNKANIELLTNAPNKNSIVFFDGFESRSAGGGRPRGPRPGEGPAGGGAQQVLYSVRWVPSAHGKDKNAPAPRAAAGKKEDNVIKGVMDSRGKEGLVPTALTA